ncbi:MAG: HesA/MoeB/ThiF family protein [Candidatus Bathyarchaeota archaeon]|nr:HesA/MoeB/ThiF family protein [Candidatus Bathyarchaeota archaeon]
MVESKIFNPEEFYSRQIVLPELKLEGQERLRRSKAVVIGLGGLGTISALYLALAGVGHLRLVDQDTVELSNLHRQALYGLKSLRYPKVEAAAERIGQMNPEVKVESIPENVRESNVHEVIKGMNCVVDGLDNMRTRYLLNRACVNQKIPYVFGAAIGIEGNLSVFAPPETPCLECVLPNLDDQYLATCAVRGVLGATPGIIGSMQAMEAIKLLAGMGDSLKGKLMVCDFRDMFFTTIEIFKRSDCPVCQGKPARPVEGTERLAWLCGRNTVNVNPPRPLEVSLGELYERLRRHFRIIMKSPLVIVFEHDGVEVSLFNQGRMLIKNVKDEESALEIYGKVMQKLGLNLS